jgi:hypothetical protein
VHQACRIDYHSATPSETIFPWISTTKSATDCGGAGTGCGWCIPFLKQIFNQAVKGGVTDELESLTAEEYEKRRAGYVRSGKGTPPPGATPLPLSEEGS